MPFAAQGKQGDLLKRGMAFMGFVGLSVLASLPTWPDLLSTALQQEHSSHILLIPAVAVALLFLDGKKIFVEADWALRPGIPLALAGGIIYAAARLWTSSWQPTDRLALEVFGVVTTWMGAALACYGQRILRVGLFPFAFLYLLVPLPSFLLDGVTAWLLRGSTEVTDFLFTVAKVPVFRNRNTFVLSSVTIEVARECSGIRSSIALFITSLLAGYFLLKSPLRRAWFVVATFPILVVKNGVRIVTLTLLSVYVDPSFLTGRLHRSGGVFFFVLGLVLMYPILRFLEKGEQRAIRKAASPRSRASAAETWI